MDLSSLPHARGGVSLTAAAQALGITSSPRPWGCFFLCCPSPVPPNVFPTPVGVFLILTATLTTEHRLPHARGGVSTSGLSVTHSPRSSPRPWGCFCYSRKPREAKRVFPTPVGVFLGICVGTKSK